MIPSTLITASHYRRTKRQSQSEAAYQTIKEKIVTLELPPASLLNETQLMESLDLGRTPIREALQRLARENLVVILPRQGTIVADLNLSDLQKIFEVRLELEIFAARLAAERATAEQIDCMERLLKQVDTRLDTDNRSQLLKLDHEFHAAIAQAAQNEFLQETLEWLYTHVLRLWHVALNQVQGLPDGIRDHRDIVAALKAKDGERAADIMRQHITNFQNEFSAIR